MQVILLERVEKLGQMGDEVRVKDGFARNFLLPKKKALRATKANREYFQTQKAQLEARNLAARGEACRSRPIRSFPQANRSFCPMRPPRTAGDRSGVAWKEVGHERPRRTADAGKKPRAFRTAGNCSRTGTLREHHDLQAGRDAGLDAGLVRGRERGAARLQRGEFMEGEADSPRSVRPHRAL